MRVKKSLIEAYKGCDISDDDRLDLLRMMVRDASRLAELNHDCILSVYLCDGIELSIGTGTMADEANICVWSEEQDLISDLDMSIPVEYAVNLFICLCKLYHSLHADIDAAIDKVVSDRHRAADRAIANAIGALK